MASPSPRARYSSRTSPRNPSRRRRGWNQWRAASFAATTWIGATSCAAKLYGYHPETFPFSPRRTRRPRGRTSSSRVGDPAVEAAWRAFLGLTVCPVAIFAAWCNGATFGHVCLAEEVARPHHERALHGGTGDGNDDEGEADGDGNDEGSRKRSRSPPRKKTKKTGASRYRPDVESGVADDTATRDTATALASFAGVFTAPFRLFVRLAACISNAPSEGSRRDGLDFVRSPHRRDRVVAWLCEFRRLDHHDRGLCAKVAEARGPDPIAARAAGEELLVLAHTLLSDPEEWTRVGSDALPRHALARRREPWARRPRRRPISVGARSRSSFAVYDRTSRPFARLPRRRCASAISRRRRRRFYFIATTSVSRAPRGSRRGDWWTRSWTTPSSSRRNNCNARV